MDNEENKEQIDEEFDESLERVEVDNNFGGYFHERDSLAENNIVEEVKTSFLEYSMSVIASRALPDLRDGLKPVHRRILWSMYESGYTPDKPHRKSAKTVGEVMGNYHPHGDSSIYEAMVRMAQDFNQRYMLIDGHGNFGNIEGDGAAAMRYTESRLAKISLELLRDINKDTVDMDDNFDVTRKEPRVLPGRFPNVLVNGAMGIAVGMATNIPPHNLGEVIDGCVAYIDNPDIDTLGLMQHIKGPDFPTGGLILGNSGIKQAYDTGRGTITIRSKAIIEDQGSHSNIVITEVPYGVNTMELKNKVAELVHNKTIDGIADYHTDLKDGVKITITLKKDANPQVVLNNLYKHTNFQVTYGIILLMLDGLTPKTLSLKSIISKYIDFQKEVIIRRTRFDLAKDEKRVHILEGYKIALDNIDEVVKIIRNAETDVEAKESLMEKFGLSEIQTDAILELKLRRLTGLERDKIEAELAALLAEIEELKSILASEQKVLEIIKKEMLEIKSKYSDDRRTTIDMTAVDYIEDESLIPVENILIALTNKGYIKRITNDTFKVQHRGGVGIKGMSTNEEDFPEKLLSMKTHDYILMFSNLGKVYRMKGYEVPEFSRQAKGLPIVNLLPLEKEEKITSVVTISAESDQSFLTFITKRGLIKRTAREEFDNIRSNGKKAIILKDDDELIAVRKTDGTKEIIIGASNGKLVRFNETEVRVMGRGSSGVKGIELGKDETVIGAEVVEPNAEVLIVTEKGYGKKTPIDEYRLTHRGSKGVKTLNITDKNGCLVSLRTVYEDEDLIIITDSGMTIRISINQISTLSRNTQGVRLISLKEEQKVSTTAIIAKEEMEETDEIGENVELTETVDNVSRETEEEKENE
ncbi:MAG: DNA gyrase subunit A [Bacilli bacterium]|nr:DNA gyrase subunit A [Bacilli bacterium]